METIDRVERVGYSLYSRAVDTVMDTYYRAPDLRDAAGNQGLYEFEATFSSSYGRRTVAYSEGNLLLPTRLGRSKNLSEPSIFSSRDSRYIEQEKQFREDSRNGWLSTIYFAVGAGLGYATHKYLPGRFGSAIPVAAGAAVGLLGGGGLTGAAVGGGLALLLQHSAEHIPVAKAVVDFADRRFGLNASKFILPMLFTGVAAAMLGDRHLGGGNRYQVRLEGNNSIYYKTTPNGLESFSPEDKYAHLPIKLHLADRYVLKSGARDPLARETRGGVYEQGPIYDQFSNSRSPAIQALTKPIIRVPDYFNSDQYALKSVEDLSYTRPDENPLERIQPWAASLGVLFASSDLANRIHKRLTGKPGFWRAILEHSAKIHKHEEQALKSSAQTIGYAIITAKDLFFARELKSASNLMASMVKASASTSKAMFYAATGLPALLALATFSITKGYQVHRDSQYAGGRYSYKAASDSTAKPEWFLQDTNPERLAKKLPLRSIAPIYVNKDYADANVVSTLSKDELAKLNWSIARDKGVIAFGKDSIFYDYKSLGVAFYSFVQQAPDNSLMGTFYDLNTNERQTELLSSKAVSKRTDSQGNDIGFFISGGYELHSLLDTASTAFGSFKGVGIGMMHSEARAPWYGASVNFVTKFLLKTQAYSHIGNKVALEEEIKERKNTLGMVFNAAAYGVLGVTSGILANNLLTRINPNLRTRSKLIAPALLATLGAVYGLLQPTYYSTLGTSTSGESWSNATESITKLYGTYAATGQGYGLYDRLPTAIAGALVATTGSIVAARSKGSRPNLGRTALLAAGAGLLTGSVLSTASILNQFIYGGRVQPGKIQYSMPGSKDYETIFGAGALRAHVAHAKALATVPGTLKNNKPYDVGFLGTGNLGQMGRSAYGDRNQYNVGLFFYNKDVVNELRTAISYLTSYDRRFKQGEVPAPPDLKHFIISGVGGKTSDKLVSAIRQSKGDLYLTFPYATDDKIFEAVLYKAIEIKERGGKDKVNVLLQSAYSAVGGGETETSARRHRDLIDQIQRLGLEKVVNLYLTPEDSQFLLHAKTIVANNLFIGGSYNASISSDKYVLEIMNINRESDIVLGQEESLLSLITGDNALVPQYYIPALGKSLPPDQEAKNRQNQPTFSRQRRAANRYETGSFSHLYRPAYAEKDLTGSAKSQKVGTEGKSGILYMPTKLPDTFFIQNPGVRPTLYRDRFYMFSGTEPTGLQKYILSSADSALSPQPWNLEGFGTLINELFGDQIYEEKLGVVGTALRALGRGLDVMSGYYAMKNIYEMNKGIYTHGDARGLHKYQEQGPPQKGFFETAALTTVKTLSSTAAAMLFYFGFSHGVSLAIANFETVGLSAILDAGERGEDGLRNVFNRLVPSGHRSLLAMLNEIRDVSKESASIGGAIDRSHAFYQLIDWLGYKASDGKADTLASYVDKPGTIFVQDKDKKTWSLNEEINSRLGELNINVPAVDKTLSQDLDKMQARLKAYFTRLGIDPTLENLPLAYKEVFGWDVASGELSLDKPLLDDHFKTDSKGGLTYMAQLRSVDKSNFIHAVRPVLEYIGVAGDDAERSGFVKALDDLERIVGQTPSIRFGVLNQHTDPKVTSYGIERLEDIARSLDELARFIPANPLFYVPQIRQAFNITSVKSGSSDGDDISLKSFMGPGFQHLIRYPKEVYRSLSRMFDSGVTHQFNTVSWMFREQERLDELEKQLLKDAGTNLQDFLSTDTKARQNWLANVDDYYSRVQTHRLTGKNAYFAPDKQPKQYSAYRSLRRFLGVSIGLFAVDRLLDAYVMQNSGPDLLQQIGLDLLANNLVFADKAGQLDYYEDKQTRDAAMSQYKYTGVVPAAIRLPVAIAGATVGSRVFYEYTFANRDGDLFTEESRKLAKDIAAVRSGIKRGDVMTPFDMESKLKELAAVQNSLQKANVSRLKIRRSGKGALIGGSLALLGTQAIFSVAAFVGNSIRSLWRTDGLEVDEQFVGAQRLAAARQGYFNFLRKESTKPGSQLPNLAGANDARVIAAVPQIQSDVLVSMLIEQSMVASGTQGDKPQYTFANQIPNPIFQFAFVGKLDSKGHTMSLGAGFQFLPLLGAGSVPLFPISFRTRPAPNYKTAVQNYITEAQTVIDPDRKKDYLDALERNKLWLMLTTPLDTNTLIGEPNSEFTNALLVSGVAAWARYGLQKAGKTIRGVHSNVLDRELRGLGVVGKATSVTANVLEKSVRWSQVPMLALPNIAAKGIGAFFAPPGGTGSFMEAVGSKSRVLAPFLLSFVFASAAMSKGGSMEAMGTGFESQGFPDEYPAAVQQGRFYRSGAAVGFAAAVGLGLHLGGGFASAASMKGSKSALFLGHSRQKMYEVYEDQLYRVLDAAATNKDRGSSLFARLAEVKEDAKADVEREALDVDITHDSAARKRLIAAYEEVEDDLKQFAKEHKLNLAQLRRTGVESSLTSDQLDYLVGIGDAATEDSKGLRRALYTAKSSLVDPTDVNKLREVYGRTFIEYNKDFTNLARKAEPSMFRTSGLRMLLLGELTLLTVGALGVIGTLFNSRGWLAERSISEGPLGNVEAFFRGIGGALSLASGTDPNSSYSDQEQDRLLRYQRNLGVQNQLAKVDSTNFVGQLWKFVTSPVRAFGQLFKIPGLYKDDPKPFINLLGPVGASEGSRTWVFYTQAQSTMTDINASRFYMDIESLGSGPLKRLQAALDPRMDGWQEMIRSIRHKVARQTPMQQKGAITQSESKAVSFSAELAHALSVRQFLGKHQANQWGDELLLNLLEDLYRSGRLGGKVGDYMLPKQRMSLWSPFDGLRAVMQFQANSANIADSFSAFDALQSMWEAGGYFMATGSPERPAADLTNIAYTSRAQTKDDIPVIGVFQDLFSYSFGSYREMETKSLSPASILPSLLTIGVTATLGIASISSGMFAASTVFAALTAYKKGGDLSSKQRDVAEKAAQIATSSWEFGFSNTSTDPTTARYVLDYRINRQTFGSNPFLLSQINEQRLLEAFEYPAKAQQYMKSSMTLLAQKANATRMEINKTLSQLVNGENVSFMQTVATAKPDSIVDRLRQELLSSYSTEIPFGSGKTRRPIAFYELLGFDNVEQLKGLLDREDGPLSSLAAKIAATLEGTYDSQTGDSLKVALIQADIGSAVLDVNDVLWAQLGKTSQSEVLPKRVKAAHLDPHEVYKSRELLFRRDRSSIELGRLVEQYGVSGVVGRGVMGAFNLAGSLLDDVQIWYPTFSGAVGLGDRDEMQRRRAAYALGASTSELAFAGASIYALGAIQAAGPAAWIGTGIVAAAGVGAYLYDRNYNVGRGMRRLQTVFSWLDKKLFKPVESTISRTAYFVTRPRVVQDALRGVSLPFKVLDPIFTAIHRSVENTGWAMLANFFVPHTTDSRLAIDLESAEFKETAYGERPYEVGRSEIEDYWKQKNYGRRTRAISISAGIDSEMVSPFLRGGLAFAGDKITYDRYFDTMGHADRVLSGFMPANMISGTMMAALISRHQQADIIVHGNYAGGAADASKTQPGSLLGYALSIPAAASLTSTSSITKLVTTHLEEAVDTSAVLGVYLWRTSAVLGKVLRWGPRMASAATNTTWNLTIGKLLNSLDKTGKAGLRAKGVGKSAAVMAGAYLLGNLLSGDESLSNIVTDTNTAVLGLTAVSGVLPHAGYIGSGVADFTSKKVEAIAKDWKEHPEKRWVRGTKKVRAGVAGSVNPLGRFLTVGLATWVLTNDAIDYFSRDGLNDESPEEKRQRFTSKALTAGGVGIAASIGASYYYRNIGLEAPVPVAKNIKGNMLRALYMTPTYGLAKGVVLGALVYGIGSALTGNYGMEPNSESEREVKRIFYSATTIASVATTFTSYAWGNSWSLGRKLVPINKPYSLPAADLMDLAGLGKGLFNFLWKAVSPVLPQGVRQNVVEGAAQLKRDLNGFSDWVGEWTKPGREALGRWFKALKPARKLKGLGTAGLEALPMVVSIGQLHTLRPNSLRTEYQEAGRAMVSTGLQLASSLVISNLFKVPGLRTPFVTAGALQTSVGYESGAWLGDRMFEDEGQSGLLKHTVTWAGVGTAAGAGGFAWYRLNNPLAVKDLAPKAVGQNINAAAINVNTVNAILQSFRNPSRTRNPYQAGYRLEEVDNQLSAGKWLAMAAISGNWVQSALSFVGFAATSTGLVTSDKQERMDKSNIYKMSHYRETQEQSKQGALGGALLLGLVGLFVPGNRFLNLTVGAAIGAKEGQDLMFGLSIAGKDDTDDETILGTLLGAVGSIAYTGISWWLSKKIGDIVKNPALSVMGSLWGTARRLIDGKAHSGRAHAAKEGLRAWLRGVGRGSVDKVPWLGPKIYSGVREQAKGIYHFMAGIRPAAPPPVDLPQGVSSKAESDYRADNYRLYRQQFERHLRNLGVSDSIQLDFVGGDRDSGSPMLLDTGERVSVYNRPSSGSRYGSVNLYLDVGATTGDNLRALAHEAAHVANTGVSGAKLDSLITYRLGKITDPQQRLQVAFRSLHSLSQRAGEVDLVWAAKDEISAYAYDMQVQQEDGLKVAPGRTLNTFQDVLDADSNFSKLLFDLENKGFKFRELFDPPVTTTPQMTTTAVEAADEALKTTERRIDPKREAFKARREAAKARREEFLQRVWEAEQKPLEQLESELAWNKGEIRDRNYFKSLSVERRREILRDRSVNYVAARNKRRSLSVPRPVLKQDRPETPKPVLRPPTEVKEPASKPILKEVLEAQHPLVKEAFEADYKPYYSSDMLKARAKVIYTYNYVKEIGIEGIQKELASSFKSGDLEQEVDKILAAENQTLERVPGLLALEKEVMATPRKLSQYLAIRDLFHRKEIGDFHFRDAIDDLGLQKQHEFYGLFSRVLEADRLTQLHTGLRQHRQTGVAPKQLVRNRVKALLADSVLVGPPKPKTQPETKTGQERVAETVEVKPTVVETPTVKSSVSVTPPAVQTVTPASVAESVKVQPSTTAAAPVTPQPTAQQRVYGFKTAKGSVYSVNEQGQVQRYKMFRPEHGLSSTVNTVQGRLNGRVQVEFGFQEAAPFVAFTSNKNFVMQFGAGGMDERALFVNLANKQVVLVNYYNQSNARKINKADVNPLPSVGDYPLEFYEQVSPNTVLGQQASRIGSTLWGSGLEQGQDFLVVDPNVRHIGNPVVEVYNTQADYDAAVSVVQQQNKTALESYIQANRTDPALSNPDVVSRLQSVGVSISTPAAPATPLQQTVSRVEPESIKPAAASVTETTDKKPNTVETVKPSVPKSPAPAVPVSRLAEVTEKAEVKPLSSRLRGDSGAGRRGVPMLPPSGGTSPSSGAGGHTTSSTPSGGRWLRGQTKLQNAAAGSSGSRVLVVSGGRTEVTSQVIEVKPEPVVAKSLQVVAEPLQSQGRTVASPSSIIRQALSPFIQFNVFEETSRSAMKGFTRVTMSMKTVIDLNPRYADDVQVLLHEVGHALHIPTSNTWMSRDVGVRPLKGYGFGRQIQDNFAISPNLFTRLFSDYGVYEAYAEGFMRQAISFMPEQLEGSLYLEGLQGLAEEVNLRRELTSLKDPKRRAEVSNRIKELRESEARRYFVAGMQDPTRVDNWGAETNKADTAVNPPAVQTAPVSDYSVKPTPLTPQGSVLLELDKLNPLGGSPLVGAAYNPTVVSNPLSQIAPVIKQRAAVATSQQRLAWYHRPEIQNRIFVGGTSAFGVGMAAWQIYSGIQYATNADKSAFDDSYAVEQIGQGTASIGQLGLQLGSQLRRAPGLLKALGNIPYLDTVIDASSVGFAGYRMYIAENEKQRAKAREDMGQAVGSVAGGYVGTVIGGAIGSLFGPMGTAAGAFVGNFIGNYVGGWVGSQVVTNTQARSAAGVAGAQHLQRHTTIRTAAAEGRTFTARMQSLSQQSQPTFAVKARATAGISVRQGLSSMRPTKVSIFSVGLGAVEDMYVDKKSWQETVGRAATGLVIGGLIAGGLALAATSSVPLIAGAAVVAGTALAVLGAASMLYSGYRIVNKAWSDFSSFTNTREEGSSTLVRPIKPPSYRTRKLDTDFLEGDKSQPKVTFNPKDVTYKILTGEDAETKALNLGTDAVFVNGPMVGKSGGKRGSKVTKEKYEIYSDIVIDGQRVVSAKNRASVTNRASIRVDKDGKVAFTYGELKSSDVATTKLFVGGLHSLFNKTEKAPAQYKGGYTSFSQRVHYKRPTTRVYYALKEDGSLTFGVTLQNLFDYQLRNKLIKEGYVAAYLPDHASVTALIDSEEGKDYKSKHKRTRYIFIGVEASDGDSLGQAAKKKKALHRLRQNIKKGRGKQPVDSDEFAREYKAYERRALEGKSFLEQFKDATAPFWKALDFIPGTFGAMYKASKALSTAAVSWYRFIAGGGLQKSVDGFMQGVQSVIGGRSSESVATGSMAPFFNYIARIEAGKGGWDSLFPGTTTQAVYGKPTSEITIGEAIRKGQGAGAIGRFQFKADTLSDTYRSAGLSLQDKLTPENQMKLATARIKSARPTLWAYLTGKSDNIEQALLEASMEWAAIPNPRTGRSFYSRDGVNKHGSSVQEGYEALRQTRELILKNGVNSGVSQQLFGGRPVTGSVTVAPGQGVNQIYITEKRGRADRWGGPRSGRRHAGQDFNVKSNTPIQAYLGGVITQVRYQAGANLYNNYIDIYNPQLGVVERIAEYGRKQFTEADVGKVIAPGTIVGYGSTSGPSVVHREIRKDLDSKKRGGYGFEGTLDPLEFLQRHGIVRVETSVVDGLTAKKVVPLGAPSGWSTGLAMSSVQYNPVLGMNFGIAGDKTQTAPAPSAANVSSSVHAERRKTLSMIPDASLDPLRDLMFKGEGGVESINVIRRDKSGNRITGYASTFTEQFGKPAAQTTLGEIRARQRQTGTVNGRAEIGAVGYPQFIGNTLQMAMNYLGLTEETKFTRDVQNQLFKYLLFVKRPDLGRRLLGAGGATDKEAAQELAREMASVGLSYSEAPLKQLQESGTKLAGDRLKDAQQKRQKGQSLYAGVAGNAASTSPETAQRVISQTSSLVVKALGKNQAATILSRLEKDSSGFSDIGRTPTAGAQPIVTGTGAADGVTSSVTATQNVPDVLKALMSASSPDAVEAILRANPWLRQYANDPAAAVGKLMGAAGQAVQQTANNLVQTLSGGESNAPYVSAGTTLKPSNVSSPYGMRLHPIKGTMRMHKGVDVSALNGRSTNGMYISFAQDLRVVNSGYGDRKDGRGYWVELAGGNGLSFRIFHMQESALARNGSVLKAGQAIGRVGNTGGSTGPHLHFEAWINGQSVNPVEYLGQVRLGGRVVNKPTKQSQAQTTDRVANAVQQQKQAEQVASANNVVNFKGTLPREYREAIRVWQDQERQVLAAVDKKKQEASQPRLVTISAPITPDLDMSGNYTVAAASAPKQVTEPVVVVSKEGNDKVYRVEHRESDADMQYEIAGQVPPTEFWTGEGGWFG